MTDDPTRNPQKDGDRYQKAYERGFTIWGVWWFQWWKWLVKRR